MATDNRQRKRHAPASLAVQVTQAELQVLHGRQLLALRASMFSRNIRCRLTSPATLLLAAGVGFAAGLFTSRPTAAPDKNKHPRGANNKLFERVLKAIAFARTLSTTFSPAPQQPTVSTSFSDHGPEPQFTSAALS